MLTFGRLCQVLMSWHLKERVHVTGAKAVLLLAVTAAVSVAVLFKCIEVSTLADLLVAVCLCCWTLGLLYCTGATSLIEPRCVILLCTHMYFTGFQVLCIVRDIVVISLFTVSPCLHRLRLTQPQLVRCFPKSAPRILFSHHLAQVQHYVFTALPSTIVG